MGTKDLFNSKIQRRMGPLNISMAKYILWIYAEIFLSSCHLTTLPLDISLL